MKLFRKMVWSLITDDNDFAQKVGFIFKKRDILVSELSVVKIRYSNPLTFVLFSLNLSS